MAEDLATGTAISRRRILVGAAWAAPAIAIAASSPALAASGVVATTSGPVVNQASSPKTVTISFTVSGTLSGGSGTQFVIGGHAGTFDFYGLTASAGTWSAAPAGSLASPAMGVTSVVATLASDVADTTLTFVVSYDAWVNNGGGWYASLSDAVEGELWSYSSV